MQQDVSLLSEEELDKALEVLRVKNSVRECIIPKKATKVKIRKNNELDLMALALKIKRGEIDVEI